MRKFLLDAVKALVSIAALFCLLSFLGGFSDKQSILLALLLYAAYSRDSLSAKEQKFVPFTVFVTPNLHNILQDFELVRPTEGEWPEIGAGVEKLSKELWNIWHNKGFSFSFITPELIYHGGSSLLTRDWHSFSTEEIDLDASLEPVAIVREQHKPDSMFRNYFPYLNLRGGRQYGCILTLTLLDWYWDKIKDKEILKSIPKMDVSDDRLCGTVDIILARVAPQEFAVHQVMAGTWDKKFADAFNKAVQARKQFRTLYGWTGKAHTDMHGRETVADRSNEAEHRYCTVAHSTI